MTKSNIIIDKVEKQEILDRSRSAMSLAAMDAVERDVRRLIDYIDFLEAEVEELWAK